MTPLLRVLPRWSTASIGRDADTTPVELSALGEHLRRCSQANGRWLTLRCVAERINGFATARFVTSLLVLLLIGAGTWLL